MLGNFPVRLAIAAIFVSGISPAESLETILARMDQNAKAATSFAAGFKETEYTATVNLFEEKAGQLRLKRAKSGVIGIMDYQTATVRGQAPKPSPSLVHFTGGDVQLYKPKANLLEIYKVGSRGKPLNQYLLLAFGLSGAEVKQNYATKWIGEEMVGALKTTRIELIPKDKEALKLISKVELWILDGQAYAVQVKVTKEGGRNYQMWVYDDAKLNPSLPDSAFTFVPPPGVESKILK